MYVPVTNRASTLVADLMPDKFNLIENFLCDQDFNIFLGC